LGRKERNGISTPVEVKLRACVMSRVKSKAKTNPAPASLLPNLLQPAGDGTHDDEPQNDGGLTRSHSLSDVHRPKQRCRARGGDCGRKPQSC
jgi:hypothetical protein